MAGYQNLSEFELVVKIGARDMGHSNSEVERKFGFSRTIISRTLPYRNPAKHQIFDIAAPEKDHARTGQTKTDENH
ncbi:hypothetical protein TNCV_4911001 [Trichonephila clavipes]|nr:hypothetical protein TNCV_4911001 [Trichonephila clavipes]